MRCKRVVAEIHWFEMLNCWQPLLKHIKRPRSTMGGSGSGRHGTRTTVEACLVFSADRLMHLKVFDQTGHHWGLLKWQNTSTGETIAVAQYKMDTLSDSLLLRYTITRSREPLEYTVRLTST